MRKARTMRPEEDAVGQAIMAFYEGRKSFEVIERNDDYFEVTGTQLYFTDYEKWGAHEKSAIDYAWGRVLDIGCGAGRHSTHLQKKGLDVTAIDRSPLAIKTCKLREVKKAKVMHIENMDFKADSFDTILMMGGNFALFGTPRRAQKILKKLHKITPKDGIIIAEAVTPYCTDNPAQLRYYDLNKKKGKLCGQWRIRIRFHNFATQWFDLLYVSKKEMKGILKGTGWQVQKFLDSGNPAYIAIIKKTKSLSAN